MKKIRFVKLALALSLFLMSIGLSAQEEVNVGDKYVIGNPTSSQYQFIKVPKDNFIIKKGGIADKKSLTDNVVVVKEVITDKKGNTLVVLERSNGKKFFNAYSTLKANLKSAVETGELRKI